MFNVQEQKYVPLSIHLAKRQFFLLSQGRNTVGEYYDQFKNQTDVLSHIGAGIGEDVAIMRQVLRSQGINVDEATDAQEEAAEAEGTQWYLTLAFLMGSDCSRFGWLLEKLENDFTAGNDNYPKTLTDAYNMLLEWKDDPRLLMHMAGNDGISFATNMLETNEEQDTEGETTEQQENETTHTHTTWVVGAEVTAQDVMAGEAVVAATATTSNASAVGQWGTMRRNALKPLKTHNACWLNLLKQVPTCSTTTNQQLNK